MEILQFLLSFFLKELGGDKFAPILEAFQKNSFDIKKTLGGLSPETFSSLLKSFSSSSNSSPTQSYGLLPIAEIADQSVVYSLNRYFKV